MKELVFDTNFNGKLDREDFIHISFAPINPVRESDLKELAVINVKDGSHDPVICRIVDIGRCQLIDLNSEDTLQSYGLPANDFVDWWVQKYPYCNACTEMAVYVYRKVNAMEMKGGQKELFAA